MVRGIGFHLTEVATSNVDHLGIDSNSLARPYSPDGTLPTGKGLDHGQEGAVAPGRQATAAED